ncbi:MAG: hypothetical protein QG633_609 [Patescibacteria group bacterium]|jgi:hypothetical protein|nr:hypothetical protein [Patescibacteria group bacterium]
MIAAIQPPFTYLEDFLVKLRQYWEKTQERWNRAETATMNFIRDVDFIGTLVMIVVTWIYLIFLILKILAPLIPFTLAFFITAWACSGRDRTNKMLAFGGIALYLLSWPMATAWGEWGAVGTLFLAIGLYFGAIFRAIDGKHPAPTRAFA